MRIYKKHYERIKELDKLYCDKCKILITPHEDSHSPCGTGGFNSKFGDMSYWEVDFCADCWYELIKNYVRYPNEQNY